MKNGICKVCVLVLAASFFILPLNARAGGCDIDKLNFGVNQDSLKNQFKLDILDVSTEGDAIITVGGSQICSDIPGQVIAELVLIDNIFVQMRLINPSNEGEHEWDLRTYAKSIFGKPANIKEDEKTGKDTEMSKFGIWVKDGHYSVIYTAYDEGRNKLEKLEIVSKRHKKLFEGQAVSKGKAIDDDMKKRGVGKYSTDSKNKKNNDKKSK